MTQPTHNKNLDCNIASLPRKERTCSECNLLSQKQLCNKCIISAVFLLLKNIAGFLG